MLYEKASLVNALKVSPVSNFQANWKNCFDKASQMGGGIVELAPFLTTFLRALTIYQNWLPGRKVQYQVQHRSTPNSVVWPVPYVCAQPFHLGSGSHGRNWDLSPGARSLCNVVLMSPYEDERAFRGCHCPGHMAVRMRKFLATPRSWCVLHCWIWYCSERSNRKENSFFNQNFLAKSVFY